MMVEEAINTLQKAMQDDPNYAWGWHCNITMAIFDTGVASLRESRVASARVLQNCFAIDITQHPDYDEDDD